MDDDNTEGINGADDQLEQGSSANDSSLLGKTCDHTASSNENEKTTIDKLDDSGAKNRNEVCMNEEAVSSKQKPSRTNASKTSLSTDSNTKGASNQASQSDTTKKTSKAGHSAASKTQCTSDSTSNVAVGSASAQCANTKRPENQNQTNKKTQKQATHHLPQRVHAKPKRLVDVVPPSSTKK